MKYTRINRKILIFAFLFQVISLLVIGCQPIKEFQTFDTYQGGKINIQHSLVHDPGKKSVVLIADNEGTEIFDLLAPFYLFNVIDKANVYLLAPQQKPIILRKGLFTLPHYSFTSFDEKEITPDLIIVPNLSTMKADFLNQEIIQWIKSNHQKQTSVLSICDGALTAAATGIYDGKPITTHASDQDLISKQFDEPEWVKDISVTQSGWLYSTAGVSNAVEGSLIVIKDMFGLESMRKAMKEVHYPSREPKLDHKSIPISLKHKGRIVRKVAFTPDPHIGVLIHEGVSSFELAAVLDTYHRTFPASIKSYTVKDQPVVSKFGLPLIPTGRFGDRDLDEIHVLYSEQQAEEEIGISDSTKRFFYHDNEQHYIFDHLLNEIKLRYGSKYQEVVKVLLDYN
jgi:transcriptional regulator GlxA family with amidase domain